MRPLRPGRWFASTAPAALILFAASQALAGEGSEAAAAGVATEAAASADAAPNFAPSGAAETSALDPASLVLVSVELDSLTLSEGIAAYGDTLDPHLPIGELTRLLEMDVDIFPAEKRVIGRIGESRRSLVIDVATNTVRDGAKTVKLAPGDLAATPTEIYLKASAMARLMPFKPEMNSEALSLKIVPTEPLPIQSRMERIARQRSTGADQASQTETLLGASPYRFLSLPAFDVQLGAGVQSEAPKTPFRYDVRAAADIGWSNFQGYVGSDEEGRATSARVLFERRSIEGRLLGPLKARVVSAGDVYAPALSLGPRGVGGRGFAFSTVPLDQTNIFNRIDLRGELPLGYDVELYVNEVLRSGQNTPAKGRYEFLNVPLAPGINVVRIVTYGPRGERSEQTRIINVGGGQLRQGEANLELGVVEQEKEVIAISRGQDGEVTLGDGAGGVRAVATMNYGLTSVVTMSAGFAQIPYATQEDRQVYNLGLRTSIFGFATQLDAANDSKGGQAAFLGLAGQVAGASVVLRHAEFRRGFLDENGAGFDISRPTRTRTELTVDASLTMANRVVPVSARTAYYLYSDGRSSITAALRVSSTLANILVSSGLEYERTFFRGESSDRLAGFFAGSTYRDYTWQLRATLDYDILPELKARSLAITADRDISESWALRFGVGQPLDDLKGTNFTAASIHRTRLGDLSISGEYNNQDQSWRLGAQLAFGLDFNPAIGRYQMTRPGPGSGGSVLFRAFMDDNANGVWDPGEEGVKNVTLEGAERKVTTDAKGQAFIPSVGAGPTTRLVVGLDQVENASVQTPPTTLELRPRPGAMIEVNYPMRPTGDLLVRLMLRRPDGRLVGLSAARLRLVGKDGKAIEAGTEYDGSAVFAGVPIGTYKVELDAEQAQRLRMRLAKDLEVEVKSDSGFGGDVEAEVVFEGRTQVGESDPAQPLEEAADQGND